MDDEWEEEEQMIVVELSGMVNSDLMSNRQGRCKIVDIDSEQPMMQVGRYLFAGEYEDAIGTCVIFEEDRDASAASVKYKCHTMKKLMLQRTFISERKEDEPITNRIEMLALQDEDSFIRRTVCNTLEKTQLEESKDDEGQEMRADVTEDSTEIDTSLLENFPMDASSSSVLQSTLEIEDGS
ncbi:hypothetical protein DNTS_030368 [Danionella cerebrum]|uniref:Transcription factor TFIIIC triple barrel domain-containing protein n=1 Tax=Danionella cerebrum TaxID=2873325 RepID=A0A553QWE4_9TELE|nr:hypothetical protein DNTS_030368 [Danionella translucida]